ncbi:hypothetical protein [Aquicella lusitana]|uniref:Secreted protein n=1 Tax=Aquicella lusitana TaxID=254246 RepID=A0A370H450_9COXI|nr:hypothetical protein [Aquicella lusitana]RDI48824.1 hypothetical protein C8D86_101103 [Aquicella lusitana]VVC73252.1 hypothetical protein AQULUS_09840 [Aquicella lusitana]
MKMKKMGLFFLAASFSLPVCADVNLEPLLNKVTLQLRAEQWVTTKTALVNVGVNAAVTDQGIEKIQNDVMQKLNKLSDKGEWHIVSYNRQLDRSGLESIQMTAQARLPQSELANLRDKAKSLSKPGETFTIDAVQFTPSDEEFREANNTLRNSIYQQAKMEIDTLNKQYADQKYYLHQIDFISPPIVPMPIARNEVFMAKAAGAAAAQPLSVGNKQELQATVVLASMPDQVAQKLARNN